MNQMKWGMKRRAAHGVAMLCAALGVAMLCTALASRSPALAESAEIVPADIPEGAAVIDLSDLSSLPAGVSAQDGDVVVADAGEYWVTGALNGCLAVSAGKKDEVTLVLCGASVTNADGPALYVENAEHTTIELAEGSRSALRSGEAAALDGSAADADAEGGALWAKDDLTISGDGALFVGGYLNNGVHTSNALAIESGALTIEAVNNGIKGKDSVTLAGGSVAVTAGGDGVKSDGDGGEGFGVVIVTDGALDVKSAGDAVQAETLLEITGGEIRAVSGGGSANAPAHEDAGRGFGGRGMGGFRPGGDGMGRGGRMKPGDGAQPDGTPPEAPDGELTQPPEMPGGEAPDAPASEQDEQEPDGAKGLKSNGVLRVAGGSITVDAADDALHANGSVEIAGGELNLSAGDDGVHADETLSISGGRVTVATSYEGLEANQIAIGGGEIDVTASDDGVNANGGNASWGRGTPWAGAQTADGKMPNLIVTGGKLYVNARGDGLDSNGNILVEGGEITVDGPSDSGNGALDSGAESGGVCEAHGGTVIAVGSAGMAEAFGDGSTQVSLQYVFDETLPAGTELTVTSANGETLIAHTAARSFDSAVFSSPKLTVGDTVTVSAGEQSAEVTLTETVTRAGAAAAMRGRGRW